MSLPTTAFTRRRAALAMTALVGAVAAAPHLVRAADELSVALILTGPISDGGWNQLAYEGLKELGGRPGFKVAYAESVTQARIPEVVRGYADDGYGLIIGHGFEFGSAFLEIAPDYPGQKFFASTFKPQDEVPPNAEYVDLAYLDAAYAAGAFAALISEKKQAVGFVGGGDNPTQQRMSKAFVAGAERTVSGIKGIGIVTGDYNNAAKGKEAAATMIGNGADVIWHAADVTGLGAIQGAAAGGAKVIGCYADQTSMAPERMATSFVMNLNGMVIRAAESIQQGSFAGGGEWRPTVKEMWLLQYGGKLGRNSALVSDQAWGDFQKILDDVASHKIDVAALTK